MDALNSMPMSKVFVNSHSTPLYSAHWTPSSSGSYAATCLFLVLLGISVRCLIAYKAVCEQRWIATDRNRRFVLVKGKSTEAGKIDSDPDAKVGSLITTNGVEENVKVVRAGKQAVLPFRLSVDLPRAFLVTVIGGVSYLL